MRLSENINTQDYSGFLGSERRILLFWDAHGYEIANTVFARILPILKGREVLVVCRDMLDNQYSNTSYDGRPIWVRQEQQLPLPAVHLGTVYSNFEQVVPIVDFCSRNRLPFHSATHSLAEVPESRDVLGAEEGWPGYYWHYFATDGSGITYPSPRSMSGNPENNSPRINFASSLDGRLTEASEKVQKLQGAVATMTGRLEAVEAAYDNVREQLDALTERIQNWLLPTLAKHSAAIRRRRNWLSPVGDWSRAGGRRRQTSPLDRKTSGVCEELFSPSDNQEPEPMYHQEKRSIYQPSLPVVEEAAAVRIRESRMDWFHSIEVGTHITPGMGPGYVENWEFVSEFLRRHASVVDGARALEPACADGLWTCWLTKLGARHIDATDLGDREQFRLIARAFGLPVAYYPGILSTSLPQTLSSKYDLVCSLGLLYHVHDPLATLIMYRGYLRPGGWLILETGAIDEAAPYLHYTGAGEIYGREGGNQFLPTLGFLHSALSELGMTIVDQAFRSEGIEDKMGRPAGRAILIAQRTGLAAMYLYQQMLEQLGMTGERFPPDP